MATFVKIEAREIFDRLDLLEKNTTKQHSEIILQMQNYKSQVARLKYMIGGCFATLGFILTVLVAHIMR